MIMRFVPGKAPHGLTRERFVQELHDNGLWEVDIKKSTGLLHKEPLFTSSEALFPHLYPDGLLEVHKSYKPFKLHPWIAPLLSRNKEALMFYMLGDTALVLYIRP